MLKNDQLLHRHLGFAAVEYANMIEHGSNLYQLNGRTNDLLIKKINTANKRVANIRF